MTGFANAAMAVTLVFCGAVVASAEPSLHLEFKGGRVWLLARDVSTAEILREWARIAGTKIVNADVVGRAPVTLQLAGVPEREALEVILRGTAGYILGARAAESTSAATFDRIVIMPPSTGPAPPAPAASAAVRPPVADEGFANGGYGLPEELEALIKSGAAGTTLTPDGREVILPEPLVDLIRTINQTTEDIAPQPPSSQDPPRD